jgi:hypothetical protein
MQALVQVQVQVAGGETRALLQDYGAIRGVHCRGLQMICLGMTVLRHSSGRGGRWGG